MATGFVTLTCLLMVPADARSMKYCCAKKTVRNPAVPGLNSFRPCWSEMRSRLSIVIRESIQCRRKSDSVRRRATAGSLRRWTTGFFFFIRWMTLFLVFWSCLILFRRLLSSLVSGFFRRFLVFAITQNCFHCSPLPFWSQVGPAMD